MLTSRNSHRPEHDDGDGKEKRVDAMNMIGQKPWAWDDDDNDDDGAKAGGVSTGRRQEGRGKPPREDDDGGEGSGNTSTERLQK